MFALSVILVLVLSQMTQNVAGTMEHEEIYSLPIDKIRDVMPEADRFLKSSGELPYYIAFKGNELIGLCFLTSDVMPKIRGFTGLPIKILVAIDLKGNITGIEVINCVEPTHLPEFDLQGRLERDLIGRSVWEELQVGKDVDTWTGATITQRAIVEAVKEGGRKVLLDYEAHRAIPTYLILNPLPSNVTEGTLLNFTGKLVRADEWSGIPDAEVSVYGNEILLATGRTDEKGEFKISWLAIPLAPENRTLSIYARFNGSDRYGPSVSRQFTIRVVEKPPNQPPVALSLIHI